MSRRARNGEGKTTTINTRATQHLRDQLDMSASLAGRSLAQEVEERLKRSLYDVEPGELAPTEFTRHYMRKVALLLTHLEKMAGARWDTTPALRAASAATIQTLFTDLAGASDKPLDAQEQEEANRLIEAGSAYAKYLTWRANKQELTSAQERTGAPPIEEKGRSQTPATPVRSKTISLKGKTTNAKPITAAVAPQYVEDRPRRLIDI